MCFALRDAIARGEAGPDSLLPSVRQLAADLGIHWNTVARAYRRLRDEGLLSVRRGRGVFVKKLDPPREISSGTHDRIHDKVREAFVEARIAGMSLDTLKDLMSHEFREWEARNP